MILEEPVTAFEAPSSQGRLPLIQYTPSNPEDNQEKGNKKDEEEGDEEEVWEEPGDPFPLEKRHRLSQDPEFNPTDEV